MRAIEYLIQLFPDKTGAELHHFLAEIRKYLIGLKLEIKGTYQVFPIEDRGIDFLGFVHRKNYTSLRKTIKKNYIKNKNKINHWSWLKHYNSVNLKRKYENTGTNN